MPAGRLLMRQVREVLRLKHACGAPERQIATSVGIGRTAVGEYLRRAAAIGITWPVPDGMDDAELERRLFTPPSFDPPSRPTPDWTYVHAELRRRDVTLMLLWEEYRAKHADGYGYSRFCDIYAEWRRGISATMRQTHVAGEKLFVDFAGRKVPVIDPSTGEIRESHIFVAALGASNFIYVEACWSEGAADWIACHVRALASIGGVPKLLVCDNTKAGVISACRYEPGLNRSYVEFAVHYGTSILPTRVRRPRDKAKVEGAVLIVERFVLAALRDRRFFSLAELNEAIMQRVADLNGRMMRKLGKSRRELLVELDRPALAPLPTEPYRYAAWKKARVGPDYHVEVDGHFYSVPSRLIRELVDVRITDATIEIFCRSRLAAVHARSMVKNRHTTIDEHMPSAHRRYAAWTPERITASAEQIGPATAGLFAAIMRAKPHPEQGFRACLGILRLAASYGPERLEAACQRGIDIGAASYGSIASILKNGLDKAYRPAAGPADDGDPVDHPNIRGAAYYH